MGNRYKLSILSNRNLREIELCDEVKKEIKIGTQKGSDIRYLNESFFEEFSATASFVDHTWVITCSDNIYMTLDGVMKQQYIELVHGNNISVRYQNNGKELMKVSFLIDFEIENQEYNRKIDISNVSKITIGGSRDCDIYIKDELLGTDYFEFTRNENDYLVKDMSTSYGVYINGIKIDNCAQISDYGFVSIVGYSFYLKEATLYTQATDRVVIDKLNYIDEIKKNNLKYPKFNRSTRIRYIVPDKEITILPPEQLQKKPKKNILMSLIPTVIMLGMTVVLRGVIGNGGSFVIFSAISMSMGMVMSIFTYAQDNKQYKNEKKIREEKYREYVTQKEEQIRALRAEEVGILTSENPTVQTDIETVCEFDKRLYEKIPSDEDFLNVEIGIGDAEPKCKIKITPQEFKNTEDELVSLPEAIEEKYHILQQAPIILPLRSMNALGIIGTQQQRFDLLKSLTVDIVVRHYYNDVKLFYIFDDKYTEQLKWTRWLKHVNDTCGTLRNYIYDNDTKKDIMEFLYSEISMRAEKSDSATYTHYVIFVYSPFDILKHPISRFFSNASKYGFTFIFFEKSDELLPICCDKIINLENGNTGKLIDKNDGNRIVKFTYLPVTLSEVEQLALKLSCVYVDSVSLESQLISNITLYSLLGILKTDDLDLENRWNESQIYKSMAAPLGVNSKNDMVCLDLNEKFHGPHGLVAGTTGSGKSEILQSYILSMATIFHPYEVGFVIIDFKGGGMVNQFKDLPHLIGSITNIDGNEINRSLKSIKAELRKRQEVFASSGVNHIDTYIKLFKKGEATVPLPHLILIVDEFAELKNDQPEFMKELISAARIGRSLGVHLILATQKPSGVVDAQIWSNSKFKLCLKVQTTDDSKEVLKTPLAAEIKEPGRAYLQVGNNEIFELFQSAYSGAPDDSETTVGMPQYAINRVLLSGKEECIYLKKAPKGEKDVKTQLQAIVEYVSQYCYEKNIIRLPGICLPSLMDIYNYSEVEMIKDELCTIIPIGIYDDPDNQMQRQVNLNLMENNSIIIGSSQFGKTVMLQTVIRGIAEQYTPKQVNIYILDFGSRALKLMEELNHVGGVVIPGEDERIKNLFRMLLLELARRKELLAKMGITSFHSYKDAGFSDLSHIILLVDNMFAFRSLYEEYDETLLNLCREGLAVGISMVVTNLQTAGIGYKYLSNFANRICLYCNDSSEYGNLFDHCKMKPKSTAGRGLITLDKIHYEFQTFLSFTGEKEVDRVISMKNFIQTVNNKFTESKAREIPSVPKIINLDFVKTNLLNAYTKQYELPIGIDYEDVQFVTFDLLRIGTITIAGSEKSGKTNFLRILFMYLQENLFTCPAKVYILDNYERQLKQFDEEYGFVEKYTLAMEDSESILDEMDMQLQIRYETMQSHGMEAIEQEPLLIFVIQANSLFETGNMSPKANATFTKIIKKYKALKVLFVFSDVLDVTIPFNACDMMKYVKDNKNLLLYNNLSTGKLCETQAATIRTFKIPVTQGDAYYVTNSDTRKIRTIKID